MLRRDVPWLAIAKSRFGDLAAAQALIVTTPTDCYLCVRARGMLAAAGGDKRQGERWFAQAIEQGPDLPQAFTDRGAARLGWGDVAGALADARRANAISPRNPDALKLWGDALSRQGRWEDARAKYDAALKFAPAWMALRQVRAVATRHEG
jgi:tetratricopeptide (TPR) repeat protein